MQSVENGTMNGFLLSLQRSDLRSDTYWKIIQFEFEIEIKLRNFACYAGIYMRPFGPQMQLNLTKELVNKAIRQ